MTSKHPIFDQVGQLVINVLMFECDLQVLMPISLFPFCYDIDSLVSSLNILQEMFSLRNKKNQWDSGLIQLISLILVENRMIQLIIWTIYRQTSNFITNSSIGQHKRNVKKMYLNISLQIFGFSGKFSDLRKIIEIRGMCQAPMANGVFFFQLELSCEICSVSLTQSIVRCAAVNNIGHKTYAHRTHTHIYFTIHSHYYNSPRIYSILQQNGLKSVGS